MPYSWTSADPSFQGQTRELHLWPHQSLTPQGFVGFIGATLAMLLLPLLIVLGSAALWWLLPFLMASVGGMWLALNLSRRNAQVFEVLTLTDDRAHLRRRNPRGPVLEWECNRYWARPQMHERGGPVAHYVTIAGGGRKVEIGAFLSEQERMALYDELVSALRR